MTEQNEPSQTVKLFAQGQKVRKFVEEVAGHNWPDKLRGREDATSQVLTIQYEKKLVALKKLLKELQDETILFAGHKKESWYEKTSSKIKRAEDNGFGSLAPEEQKTVQILIQKIKIYDTLYAAVENENPQHLVSHINSIQQKRQNLAILYKDCLLAIEHSC